MRRANLASPDFDEPRDHPGFTCLRARVGRQIGSERLGVSLWELPPGEAAYPYHLHLTEEELVLVTDGELSLRTPGGWEQLGPGDLVSFPAGEEGAHQIVNRGERTARFLAVSTNGEPDIVRYPDEGKMAAAERNPDGSGFHAFFRESDAVGYWDGVEPPS